MLTFDLVTSAPCDSSSEPLCATSGCGMRKSQRPVNNRPSSRIGINENTGYITLKGVSQSILSISVMSSFVGHRFLEAALRDHNGIRITVKYLTLAYVVILCSWIYRTIFALATVLRNSKVRLC